MTGEADIASTTVQRHEDDRRLVRAATRSTNRSDLHLSSEKFEQVAEKQAEYVGASSKASLLGLAAASSEGVSGVVRTERIARRRRVIDGRVCGITPLKVRADDPVKRDVGSFHMVGGAPATHTTKLVTAKPFPRGVGPVFAGDSADWRQFTRHHEGSLNRLPPAVYPTEQRSAKHCLGRTRRTPKRKHIADLPGLNGSRRS